ncbi:hypothetical protein ACJ73_05321 [Blastomyces percursus]|uniref:Uncharacterized protein n=1 Tax=Blastomyces percursus TaxID=1658174 RepID=A0A1J9Q5E0_9EURO|nr:hypothetical protein ACJ73_05321 [Blastomyces percursus]
MAKSRAAIVGSCDPPLLSPGSRDSSGPDTKRIELAARRERAARPMHPEQILSRIIRDSVTRCTPRVFPGSGFRPAGLVPYDPEQVLSRLNTTMHTSNPPGTSHSSQAFWATATPHNVRQLEQQTEKL